MPDMKDRYNKDTIRVIDILSECNDFCKELSARRAAPYACKIVSSCADVDAYIKSWPIPIKSSAYFGVKICLCEVPYTSFYLYPVAHLSRHNFYLDDEPFSFCVYDFDSGYKNNWKSLEAALDDINLLI